MREGFSSTISNPMPTTQDVTGHNTPELVCVLDRELPSSDRAMDALGRSMRLYDSGEEFPGWAALQRCAWEEFSPQEKRLFPWGKFVSSLTDALSQYPRALLRKIHDGRLNISVLLNTAGGFVGYIWLFRTAAHHLLEGDRGRVRSFAVTANSAGAHIGLLASKPHRIVTQGGQYLWHTANWDADQEEGKAKNIATLQWTLLQETSRDQRKKMHQLLLNVLADERNTRHELVLDGTELQEFGIIPTVARTVEDLAATFVRRTGIRPDFWIPGRDPVARFFSHAALEEQARSEGYALIFPRLNAVRNFSLRSFVHGEPSQRHWRDVREDLLDYAAEFPWRMAEILRPSP